MSDNDSVNRGEVRRAIAAYIHYNAVLVDEWAANCIDDIVEALPVVPHEMTAREYLETEARMCKHYGLPCAFDVSGMTVDEAIEMVEKFAQEHPEERSEE